MTDHDRDLVVARALNELPVPEHLPAFWERLDARLTAEELGGSEEAGGGEPGGGARPSDRRVDTAELPAVSALRPPPPAPRAHRVRFLAAAVALAVAAVTTGLVLRGDPPAREADQASAPTTPPAPLSTPPPSTAFEPAEHPASAVVRAWVDALGRGDVEAAAALLGPRSRAYIDALGSDPTSYSFDLQEGYGGWAGASDLATTTIEVPDEGAVVVLAGTPTIEGALEGHRYEAIPVVEEPGQGWMVEPAAFDPDSGGRFEVVVPELRSGEPTGVAPDTHFEVVAEGAADYWFGVHPQPLESDDDGRWDPRGELAEGRRLLLVVALSERLFTALAVELEVGA